MSASQTSARSSMGQVVQRVVVVRRWLTKTRTHLGVRRGSDIDAADGAVYTAATADVKAARSSRFTFSIDDSGTLFHVWTSLVCLACLHPLFLIVLAVFGEALPTLHDLAWSNHVVDGLFLVDLLVLLRVEFKENGVVVSESRAMLKHRVISKSFILDVLSVLPLEQLSFVNVFYGRINRLLKCYRLFGFASLTEIRTSWPHAFRLLKLVFLCLTIFHWNGCLYFYLSKVYDFENAQLEDWIFSYDKIVNPVLAECDTDHTNSRGYCDVDDLLIRQVPDDDVQSFVDDFMPFWSNKSREMTFTKFVRQYSLSFYWSALTLVTLGEQPWPNNTFQNVFEIGDTLLGLVIFAVIVGDVGNMITSLNLERSNFDSILDGCKRFMFYRKVPKALNKKSVEFFTYIWAKGGTQVDEEEIADFLPPRLFGEIAMEIHMETLKRVRLFENCDQNLLYELILKLQLRVYSPMDYICKKGEVGTEMYIVKEGSVEVVNDDGSVVFVTLGAGVVFGELSILNIPNNKNGNLRTASVRSKGYSDLYVLNKEQLWDALREYPDAKESLIEKGRQILAKDNLLDASMGSDDVDDEFGMTIDSHIGRIQTIVAELEANFDALEQKIQKSDQHLKQLIYGVERTAIDVIKERRRKIRPQIVEHRNSSSNN